MPFVIQKMSNLDYSFLVEELQPLVGGFVNKIFELRPNVFRFKIKGEKEYNFVAELGLRAQLSKFIEESPETPSNFVMVLRKYLENAKITEIKQENDDRLLIFTLQKKEEYHLIFEMFAKGNLVLASADYTIIEPYKTEKSKTREVKRYESYLAIPNPNRLGERPKKQPEVYYSENKVVGFSCFPSSKFENAQAKSFPTISEMADEYYPAAALLKDEFEEEDAAEEGDESLKKLEFTLKQQNSAQRKFEVEIGKFQGAGNYIYNNFEQVEKIIKLAREMKRQKKPDDEIAGEISSQFGFKADVKGDKLILDVPDPEKKAADGAMVEAQDGTEADASGKSGEDPRAA